MNVEEYKKIAEYVVTLYFQGISVPEAMEIAKEMYEYDKSNEEIV